MKAKLTALKLKNGNNSIFDTVKTSSLRTMHKTLYNRNSCRRLLQTCQKIEIDIEREDSSTLIDEDAKVEPTEVAVLSQHTGLRREQSLEQGLEEILDSELMSDDDIDLLLDLEMMRRESGKKADESCSILLGDKSDAQSRASKPEDHDLEMLDGGEAVSITDKDSIILKGDDEDRDMEESSMLSVDSGDRMLC